MKAYKIINQNDSSWEFIKGIENTENNPIIAKFNAGLAKQRPYNHAVPYPRNSMFAIMKKNGLSYFLFDLCKFTYDELKEFQSMSYKLIEEELCVYSYGFSKLFCTYFEDEIVELTEVNFTDIYIDADSISYTKVEEPYVLKEDIKYCKSTYYKDVIFNN